MCFEIAHDDSFREMFVEINKLGSQQKKTNRRGHRLYEVIWIQYRAIIDRNNNLTHISENNSDLEGTSDKVNNNCHAKSQKLTESSKKAGPFVLYQKRPMLHLIDNK